MTEARVYRPGDPDLRGRKVVVRLNGMICDQVIAACPDEGWVVELMTGAGTGRPVLHPVTLQPRKARRDGRVEVDLVEMEGH